MNNYFNNLNYSIGDEDTLVEHSILNSGLKTVVCVAGSGGRSIPLVSKEPENMILVDASRSQLALADLRLRLIKQLNHEEFLSFLGYLPMKKIERERIYRSLKIQPSISQHLSEVEHSIMTGKGIIYSGRFERMLVLFSKIVKVVLGNNIDTLTSTNSIEGQVQVVSKARFKIGWSASLMLLANSTALNTILYRGDYPKKNIEESYYRFYSEIFSRLFRSVHISRSFFLQILMTGKIYSLKGAPLEANENIYENSKSALSRTKVELINGDIFSLMGSKRNVDFLSLSDVPTFLKNDEDEYLNNLSKSISDGGIVVSRNHARRITPDLKSFDLVSEDYFQEIESEATGLWTIDVYRKKA